MWEQFVEDWENAKVEYAVNEHTYTFKSGAVSDIARAIDVIIQATSATCSDMNEEQMEIVCSTVIKMLSNFVKPVN